MPQIIMGKKSYMFKFDIIGFHVIRENDIRVNQIYSETQGLVDSGLRCFIYSGVGHLSRQAQPRTSSTSCFREMLHPLVCITLH